MALSPLQERAALPSLCSEISFKFDCKHIKFLSVIMAIASFKVVRTCEAKLTLIQKQLIQYKHTYVSPPSSTIQQTSTLFKIHKNFITLFWWWSDIGLKVDFILSNKHKFSLFTPKSSFVQDPKHTLSS